jgi:WD40 repeat protein
MVVSGNYSARAQKVKPEFAASSSACPRRARCEALGGRGRAGYGMTMLLDFDAYVTDARFERSGAAVFALGDGTVRFEDGTTVQAHDGAALSACDHPSGEGLITGGDDGRLVWSRRSGAETLAEVKGRWIDVVASSAASGLIAFASGREAQVRDVKDPAFANTLTHERAVAALAFDPKGRRIAAATYGGAALWYARIAEQKPLFLKWAGSHIVLAFSPDGRFLISAMQENELHGWRLSDGADMRMGGYPSKVKALAFLDRGRMMATSGSAGAVIWPFGGSGGPMGKQAAEVGFQEGAVVTRVAAPPDAPRVAAGLDDGRVWTAELTRTGVEFLKAEKGPQITALSVSPDGRRIAWGDEEGGAGVAEIGAEDARA